MLIRLGCILYMSKICPKCNAVRPSETSAPDWQCPSCGVAYAKVGGEPPFRREAPRSRYVESAAQSDGIPWRKFFGVLLAAWALYAGYQAAHNKAGIGGSWLNSGASLSAQQVADLAAASQPQDVLFYTADWCPYCRAAKGWMQQYGFKYQECDIDKQAACAQQLKSLGSTGVPYLIVKGHHMKGGFDSDEFLVAMRQPQN
ncbi:glutaredoxin family protein [Acidovorax sp. ACV01]|nr:glutaredoxin family protein [Acidovorax sp. ACV01]